MNERLKHDRDTLLKELDMERTRLRETELAMEKMKLEVRMKDELRAEKEAIRSEKK